MQECGRNASQDGQEGTYEVLLNWVSFIKLLLTIMRPRQTKSNEPSDHDGINSLILSKTPEGKKNKSINVSTGANGLTMSDRTRVATLSYCNAIDSVNLFCMPGLGCVHTRCEWFMATGELSAPPEMILPCERKCYICTGGHRKYFLPIIYTGAIEFLRSERMDKTFPYTVEVNNCDGMLSSLTDDTDWVKRIFGKKKITKYNVTAFFFTLVGSNILSFQKKSNLEVICVLSRDDQGNKMYEKQLNWEGFEFRVSGSSSRIHSWADIFCH